MLQIFREKGLITVFRRVASQGLANLIVAEGGEFVSHSHVGGADRVRACAGEFCRHGLQAGACKQRHGANQESCSIPGKAGLAIYLISSWPGAPDSHLQAPSKTIGQVEHLALTLAKAQFRKDRKTPVYVPLTADQVVIGLLGGLLDGDVQ
jgi:hypothetical protein